MVGCVGDQQIRFQDWDSSLTAFEAKINDFNIRGQREQINHPGFVSRHHFCPECGVSLDGLKLRELSWVS